MSGRRVALLVAAVVALLVAAPAASAVTDKFVHDVQGTGSTSPLSGSTGIRVTGVLTALRSDGLFVQEEDADTDPDPATSEGIFVSTGSAPSGVFVGERVSATGTVTEFAPAGDPQSPSVTELTSPTVAVLDASNHLGEVTPSALSSGLPSASGSFSQLEQYEGMLVTVSSLTVCGPTEGTINESTATATTNGLFYGTITGVACPLRDAGIQQPDSPPSGSIPPIPRWDSNPEVLGVDSDAAGSTALNVGAGQTVTGIGGVLDYSARHYTIDPTATPTIGGSAPTITPADPAATNEYTIGTLDLGRFFQTGLSNTNFQRRVAKAALAVRVGMGAPDIVAVQEVENLASLQAIAAKISSDANAAPAIDPQYVAYLQAGTDPAGLNTGYLVRTAEVDTGVPRVAVESVTQELASNSAFTRPPLRLNAILHSPAGLGERVTVIAVDLPGLAGVDSASTGASVRAQRKAAAEALANLVQARQAATPTERIALVGNFNAYPVNDGYVDVMGTIEGTPAASNTVVASSSDLVSPNLVNTENGAAYSIVTGGNRTAVDGVLTNSVLATLNDNLEIARLGTALPLATAYNDGTTGARLSDHDGVVAYFVFPNLPTAEANGPYTVAEGSSVSLSAASSSDPQGDALTYAWDLDNDGVYGETGAGATRGNEVGATPTFNAAGVDGPAAPTVKLRVSDGSATSADDTATVSVTNVAPTASVSETAGAQATDTARSVTLVATDPAPADQAGNFTWTIDWGDGTAPSSVTGTSPASGSHTYAGPGTYTVSVSARDDDSATGAPATTSITVAAPPAGGSTGDSGGTGGGTGGTDQPGGTLSADPELTTLVVGPRAFTPLSSGPPLVATGGVRVSFVAEVAETVVFTVVRRSAGRRVARRCVKPTRKNRVKPRCTRRITVGSFTAAVPAGPRTLHFSGRLAGHRLAPGTYELRAVPSLADGRHGKPATAVFVVR